MSLCKGFTQGGSNADVVLVDSFLKNITQDVDWDTGYEALLKGLLYRFPIAPARMADRLQTPKRSR